MKLDWSEIVSKNSNQFSLQQFCSLTYFYLYQFRLCISRELYMPCACVSFHIPSHITSYHIAPYHTTPHYTIQHHTTLHHTISYHTMQHHHTISCYTTPQYTSQYHIIPHHIILHHTTLFNTIPNHTIQYFTIPHLTIHVIVHFAHATVKCNVWLGRKHFSQFISIQLDSI